jgi:hypothetical protein
MADLISFPPGNNLHHRDEGPFENYLFVTNKRSGRSWALKISDSDTLDVHVETRRFLDVEFGDHLNLVPNFSDGSAGMMWSARIITDKEPPYTSSVWSKKGFHLNGGG